MSIHLLAMGAMAAVPVATETAVSYGALTLAGAGGVALPAGATSIIDADGTNLVVDSGYVVPDTGGTVTSGTVTFNNGSTFVVTAEADTYSVANGTEFEALDAIAEATLAGKTIKLRDLGTNPATLKAAWEDARFRFIEPASTLTVRGENSSTPVWELQFTECSNITVRDLAFQAQWETSGDESAYMLKFSGNSSGTWNDTITVRDCSFSSDPGSYDPDGADAWKMRRGLQITNVNGGGQTAIRVFDNTFDHVYVGTSIIGGDDIEVYGNEYESTFADQFTGTIDVSPWDITVRDNFFGDQFGEAGRDYSGNGGPSDPHAGKIEFNLGSWGANASGIYVYRNVACNTGAHYSGNVVSIKDLSTYVVSDVEISGNVFQVVNGGITLEACDGAVVRYNTVVTNLNDLTGNTRISLDSNCVDCVVEHNVSPSFVDNGTTSTLSENITLTETAAAYNSAFAGDFTGDTMPARTKAATLAAYTPDVSGTLDPDAEADRIGAIWFDDYDAQSSTYPDPPSGNLIVDSGFDDAAAWVTPSGVSVTGGVLSFDGTAAAFDYIEQEYENFVVIADDTATYEFSIEATRVDSGGTVRFQFECTDGDLITDTDLGDTTPNRLGGSTVNISSVATYGPYSFTLQSGTTHLRVRIQVIGTGLDLDFDNAVVELA